MNSSEKVRRKTCPLRVTGELPFALSLSLSLSSPRTQECSACFRSAVLTPSAPPASLVSFSWTPYLPRLVTNNTFSPLSFFICHSLTQLLTLSLVYSVTLLAISTCPCPPEVGLNAAIFARWRKCTRKTHLYGHTRLHTDTHTHTMRSKSAEVPADVPFIAICCKKKKKVRAAHKKPSYIQWLFHPQHVNITANINIIVLCRL